MILDHDVRAAGLAELELGAGRGLQEVLFVALGTGGGRRDHQRSGGRRCTGRAGELGHLPVFPEEENAPADNADALRPMPARPPCHADTPPPVASAMFPPKTSSAGPQPATP